MYCRVSTDGQQTGLESQIQALKEWCSRNQISEFERFADEGISGAKEKRPALNRLMEMVEKDQVEQIIVFSFSRFARSTSLLLKGLKKFKDHNTRFISITESIDTNSPLRGGSLYNSWCTSTIRAGNDHRESQSWYGKRQDKRKTNWKS